MSGKKKVQISSSTSTLYVKGNQLREERGRGGKQEKPRGGKGAGSAYSYF